MSSPSRIQAALEKVFERQRVVFWYDADGEWWPEFDAVQIEGAEKVAVQNNEFGIKHRIVREEPNKRFLLYFRNQTPSFDAQNWLLDQLLAHGGQPFSPDRASLDMLEAGLAPEFKHLTQNHAGFFRSGERTAKLRSTLSRDYDEAEVVLHMIAITCRSEASRDAILLALLGELARQKSERFDELGKFGLHPAFWALLQADFGYTSSNPTLLDFCLSLFRTLAPFAGPASSMERATSALFGNRWKDSETHRASYITLAEQAARMLNVAAALNEISDPKALLENDTYRAIDLRLITDLRDHLIARDLDVSVLRSRAERRLTLFWARQETGLRQIYEALIAACDFVAALGKLDLTIESPEAGIRKYADKWCCLDTYYRRFLHHRNECGQMTLLEALSEWIEGLYLNSFLNPLAVKWQDWVDRMDSWSIASVVSQREFHSRFVQNHTSEGKKVLVVISDALRFEAASELAQRISAEDRWSAKVQPTLGVLPSYTQLGMAALLPHQQLTIDLNSCNALLDGQPSMGSANRDKILREAHGGRAGVMSTEDFLALTRDDGRGVFKEHEVLYVYHNAIDAVGDKRDTEHETCAAVEKAMAEVIRILKKGSSLNYSTMVVTADHGFLYQERTLEDSDFLELENRIGSDALHRRFVLGEVPAGTQLKTFSFAQLGLAGEGQVAFPRGIQRLRKQGAGSRYVHGGTSLQEVVVPVIEVRKERTDDVRRVGVEIIKTGQQITTGQVTLTFVQTEPVTEKQLPIELRVGFYAKTGEAISEIKTLRFASTEGDIRQRERPEQFLFSKEANTFNNQEIEFRLDESIPGTNQFTTKQKYVFRLRRAFESDFDQF